MARKRYSDEDCLKILRQIEVELANGADVAKACRSAGISDATFYTWRKKFVGMGRSQLTELKALEKETHRLKKIVADLYDIFQRQREEAVQPVEKDDVAEVLRRRLFDPKSVELRGQWPQHVIAALKGIAALDDQTLWLIVKNNQSIKRTPLTLVKITQS